MKVRYLILVQCLLITFVLYMFKDLFIITLPAWLITLPVTVPLLVYIIIMYFKKRKEKRAYKPTIKTEEKALLWLANYIHHDFTYLVHRNIFHLEKLTLEEIIKLYDHYKDVTYAKHDRIHKEGDNRKMKFDYKLSCMLYEFDKKEYVEKKDVETILVKFVKEETNELVQALKIARKRLEHLINATPTGDFRNTLTDENLMIHELIYRLTAESEIFGKTVYLEDCAWNKNPKVKTVDVRFETAHSHDYGNGRDSETYETLDAAINYCKKNYTPETNPRMTKENFEYWNKQSSVVTKVTTIKEIMSVIKPEERT